MKSSYLILYSFGRLSLKMAHSYDFEMRNIRADTSVNATTTISVRANTHPHTKLSLILVTHADCAHFTDLANDHILDDITGS